MTGAVPKIRLLHLEDSEPDHALAMAHLLRSGMSFSARRVETRSEFEAALAEPDQAWDLVLSDYHLPGFTGLQALRLLRDSGSLLPFVLVSGQIGEDTAVEAMRTGANDYLLKNNLARLAPALQQALAASHSHRARLAADRELEISRRRLSELAQHLQTSVEAERHAIAREIHDDVGGSLTALKFELDWIRRHAAAPPTAAMSGELPSSLQFGLPLELPVELPARVQSALELCTHAIESSQRIMQNLRPAILEQGLTAALQWMTSRFEKRTGIVCEFRAAAEPLGAMPVGVPLVAYRCAQEALTNTSKHAQASKVVVDLSFTGGVLSLEISDNGRGLGGNDLAKAQSFGIRGLHERASTVGGWVELSSGATGTSLMLSVPLLRVHQPLADGTPVDDGDNPDSESSAWSPL